MDIDCTTTERRQFANASEDRLSSLHDDVLIKIISHLPFPYVVITECLSRRWHGLWTHLMSINIIILEGKASCEFITNIRHLLSRITSPCIDTFSVELGRVSKFSVRSLLSIDSWIESLTNNHKTVRELKVRRRRRSLDISMPVLQKFILQTQTSLVSLKLRKLTNRQSSSDVDFNLPSLRKLKLEFHLLEDIEWLNKLIKGCPLLEILDLSCEECVGSGPYVIHAPKLKYLSVSGNNDTIFCFSKIPIALRIANVIIFNDYGEISDEENRLWSTFYKGVSDATDLLLDLLPTQHYLSSTLFRRASQLTLNIDIRYNVQTVLSFLKLCPVLNFLTLRFYETYGDNEDTKLPIPGTLQTVLQRIHVEIYLDLYDSERYFEVVEYLLSNTINLAHFELDITDAENRSVDSVELQQRRELELCKRLYNCPVASTVCKVKFVGKFYKKFQKAGPNAWIEN